VLLDCKDIVIGARSGSRDDQQTNRANSDKNTSHPIPLSKEDPPQKH
jgi:hypothetical protein